jgi:hypothetical protein
VLRLRRRTSLGSTFIKVVGDYADKLAERGGRLYLTGLEPSLTERLVRTGHVEHGRCGRSKPPRSSASRLNRPTWTPRHG